MTNEIGPINNPSLNGVQTFKKGSFKPDATSIWDGGAGSLGDGYAIVDYTPHKCNKGFFPAVKDGQPAITGKDGILANDGKKIRQSNDPAGTVADAVLESRSDHAKTAFQKDEVRAMIIKANPSVFTPEGKLKPNADFGKLDIPTIAHLHDNVQYKDAPARTVIPKGFYPAYSDKSSTINGLTQSQLRRNEPVTAGAVQVLNAVLGTKGNNLTGECKALMLNDLIKRNPSVFKKDGTLKTNADLTKLDVPSIDHMKETYLKGDKNKKIRLGNNGYYALGSGSSAKFFRADGTQITEDAFKNSCPSIMGTIQAEKASEAAHNKPRHV